MAKKGSTKIDVGGIRGNMQGVIAGGEAKDVKITITMGAMPHTAESTKVELEKLIEDLNDALGKIPQDKEAEAKKIAKMVTRLMEDASEEEPDKEELQNSGERLKKAAQNIADVVPTVLTIATKIVGTILAL